MPTPKQRLQLTTRGIANETAQQTATTTGATTASVVAIVLASVRFVFRSEPALFVLSNCRIVLVQFFVPHPRDMVLFLVGPFGLLCGQF